MIIKRERERMKSFCSLTQSLSSLFAICLQFYSTLFLLVLLLLCLFNTFSCFLKTLSLRLFICFSLIILITIPKQKQKQKNLSFFRFYFNSRFIPCFSDREFLVNVPGLFIKNKKIKLGFRSSIEDLGIVRC